MVRRPRTRRSSLVRALTGRSFLWRASWVRGASSSSSLTTRCLRATSSPFRLASASASCRASSFFWRSCASSCSLRLDLVGHDAERGLFLGLFAFHRLALTRFSESPEASVLFLVGKGAQHHARTALVVVARALGRRRLRRRGRDLRLRFLDGLRRGSAADRPALLLLHQNGLGTPMAEALTHMAGLHGPAHIERHFAATASGFVFSLVDFTHSLSVSDPIGWAKAAVPLR